MNSKFPKEVRHWVGKRLLLVAYIIFFGVNIFYLPGIDLGVQPDWDMAMLWSAFIYMFGWDLYFS